MKPEKVKFMLMAADMRRAVRFYRDVIGLEEVFVSDYWTELRHGDAIIALHGGHDGSRNATGLSFQFEYVLAQAEITRKVSACKLPNNVRASRSCSASTATRKAMRFSSRSMWVEAREGDVSCPAAFFAHCRSRH